MGPVRAAQLATLLGTVLMLAGPPASASAEIVYSRGTEGPPSQSQPGNWPHPSALWAMSDSGGAQHVLLSASKVPGHEQSLCCTATQPGSSTLIFDGWDYEYADPQGGSGAYAEGLFTLRNAVVKRLSPRPQNCSACTISDSPGALTADGRIVFDRMACEYSLGAPSACQQALYAESMGGGAPADWSTTGGNCGVAGCSTPLAFSVDPQIGSDGELIAYPRYLDSSQGGANTTYLLLGTQSGETFAIAKQPHINTASSPAWSPNGGRIVDVDSTPSADAGTPAASGFSAGLWSIAVNGRTRPVKLLSDPKPCGCTFANPVFAGAQEIVFQAHYNLWEIPATCRGCTFPAGARQLTTDGTSSDPDYDPTWTSATITAPKQR